MQMNPTVLIQQKFRNKRQLYSYLVHTLQVYLPDIHSCRMEFLKDVFCNEKNVVLNKDVQQFQVPSYPSLSVKILFPALVVDTELMSYFDTDRYQKSGKLPPKEFFWGVLYTVRKDFTMALLNEASMKRLQSADSMQEMSGGMNFSQQWIDKLMQFPVNTQGSSKSTNIFAQMNRARQPAQRKPVELPQTVVELQQHLRQMDDRHVTVRRKPNVIGNARQEGECME